MSFELFFQPQGARFWAFTVVGIQLGLILCIIIQRVIMYISWYVKRGAMAVVQDAAYAGQDFDYLKTWQQRLCESDVSQALE